jgi:hypothetical protein
VAENQESLDLFISLLSETEYFDDVVLRKEANRVKRFFAGFAKLHKTIVGQEVRCV